MKPHQIILYFVITIVIISSIGVWLPFAIDYFAGTITPETKNALPGNLMTYYLALFTVSAIDRTLVIIDNTNYNYRKTEFLISIIVSLIFIGITFMAFKNIFHKDFATANVYAVIGTILSFVIWWISKWNTIETNATNILGGEIK